MKGIIKQCRKHSLCSFVLKSGVILDLGCGCPFTEGGRRNLGSQAILNPNPTLFRTPLPGKFSTIKRSRVNGELNFLLMTSRNIFKDEFAVSSSPTIDHNHLGKIVNDE